MKVRSRVLTAAMALALAGCAAWNAPINTVLKDGERPEELPFGGRDIPDDEVFIGLAFSGGGTRASSFSYGMLKALQEATQSDKNPDGLLKHVRLVSGVSGGSVTAAYFGLHGPKGMDVYRDKYLIQNAEKYMNTAAWNPVTLARGLSGGVNSRKTFARFLDESILGGATFRELWKKGYATTWLNASDVANSTPFVFTQETFDALCSNLADLPVSEAVAASAAFPLVFSPIVLEAHQDDCNYEEPDWLTAARFNPEATSAMKVYGTALETYQDPEKIQYVKLLDGAVTDNFGTTGLSVARAKSQTPFGPMTEEQAVKVNRMLFLVANAGVATDFRWTKKPTGPGGVQLGLAIANSSMFSATRLGYDVLRLTLDQYAVDLVEWRCSLSPSTVRRLRGTLNGWDCSDVKLFVGQVNFDLLDDERRKDLDTVPTRLKLETEQVDAVIAAGLDATRLNPDFNGFLRSIDVGPPLAAPGGPAPRRILPSG